jgi:hypothetical protein
MIQRSRLFLYVGGAALLAFVCMLTLQVIDVRSLLLLERNIAALEAQQDFVRAQDHRDGHRVSGVGQGFQTSVIDAGDNVGLSRTPVSVVEHHAKKTRRPSRRSQFEENLLLGFPPSGALQFEFDPSKPSTTTSSTRSTDRKKIAVVLFGLVKRIDPPQSLAFSKYVAAPLLAVGNVDVFLHTYLQPNFTNARNGERSANVNQTMSIEILKRVFSRAHQFHVIVDHVAAAHEFFGPTAYFLPGNHSPWGASSKLSMHYFLRQQYSLIRGTQMWSGVPVTSLPMAKKKVGEVRAPYALLVWKTYTTTSATLLLTLSCFIV